MAQLSNDCFAFGGPLMSVDEARALIAARLQPVTNVERVPLTEADGRVLAETILAPVDLPPFANSAVDGYAVRFADLTPGAPSHLPLQGRVAAGATLAGEAAAGQAVRIFTGAPMPAGLDTVFMQEDVETSADGVSLPAGLKRGANMRPAGEDLARGAVALEAGRRITPREIALLAGLGIAEVPVRTRLRVAVFSTGNEIISPGEPLRPAALYDANRFMLIAVLKRLGCAVSDLGILPDRRDAVTGALAEAAESHDLLITSGGVSTGEEDHVKAAVEAAGALTFWRLGIKPGRPVALGVVGGTPFIGLPGNPVAVFVTFTQVARALVARLQGEAFTPPPALTVRAGFAYKKKEGRREYVRVRLLREADGILTAQKHPREGAGVITSLTETDGLVELPEAMTRLEPGEPVAFVAYASLL
ncbi:MAG TPA: gephyrin-like molybdotransferase Glp [Microvirga sp.]|jgi:molybdopterin molybdotransferase|nr:gephyrin-like molybdotransferase Glp [Microvirga sp.]